MTTAPELILPELSRAWPAVELPGYREHPAKWTTYSAFSYDQLPAIHRELDDRLEWLCAEPPVPSSLAEMATPPPSRAAGAEQLSGLLQSHPIKLPTSFLNFIASAEPRRRIRSTTDCYLDLAESIVPVSTGGFLVHFLSDSQFCFHWLLYAAANGDQAVVATGAPYGFLDLDDWGQDASVRSTFVPGEDSDAFVCADSFSEFLYRLWIENEIWFRLTDDLHPLTEEQQRYVGQYSRVRRPGPKLATVPTDGHMPAIRPSI